MISSQRKDAFIAIGKDGGTGKYVHASAKQAFDSVSSDDKRRAFTMLVAAGITFLFALFTRIFWLFKPLLDKISYGAPGLMTNIIYYLIVGVLCTAFIVALNVVIKKLCEVKLFRRRARTIDIARALGVIAIAAVAVFAVSATFGFQLKLQKEMGVGVSIAKVFANLSVYLYYGFHMWLGFAAAALIQYALSMLFPAKYTVPWGAVFLVTIYGLTELLLEYATTSHMFPLYYYFLTYAYAAIYILTGRSFHVSFWASVAVMIL